MKVRVRHEVALLLLSMRRDTLCDDRLNAFAWASKAERTIVAVVVERAWQAAQTAYDAAKKGHDACEDAFGELAAEAAWYGTLAELVLPPKAKLAVVPEPSPTQPEPVATPEGGPW